MLRFFANLGATNNNTRLAIADNSMKTRVNINLIGEVFIGKSAFLWRYKNPNKPWGERPTTALHSTNMENCEPHIKDSEIVVRLIDIPKRDINGEFERNKIAAQRRNSDSRVHDFFIYFIDLTSNSSDQIQMVIESSARVTTKSILVGTKSDMLDKRVISREMALGLKDRLGCEEYFECSAKTGQGVQEAIRAAINIALGLEHDYQNERSNLANLDNQEMQAEEVRAVQEVQVPLEGLQNFMVFNAAKALVVSKQKHAIKNHDNLQLHYHLMMIQLERIMLASKVIASELVKPALSGPLPVTGQVIEFAGKAIDAVKLSEEVLRVVPFGLGEFLGIILSAIATAIEKCAEASLVSALEKISSLATSKKFEKTFEKVARNLTMEFHVELMSLTSHKDIEMIVNFACTQIFGALYDGRITSAMGLSKKFTEVILNKPSDQEIFREAIHNAVGLHLIRANKNSAATTKVHEFYYKATTRPPSLITFNAR